MKTMLSRGLPLCLLISTMVVCNHAQGAELSGAEAERIVTRCYEKILNRDPDPEGLALYVKCLTEDGRDEAWLRDVLRASPEGVVFETNRKEDRRNFAIIAVIVVVIAAILFFPRGKRSGVPPEGASQ